MTHPMPRSMGRLLALALVLLAASPAAAGRVRPAQTKSTAEVNVLRTVARKWNAWGKYGFVDPKTHLLTDNTQAVCRGRGKARPGKRYARFVCVVRPHVHRGRQGLWLRYRALRQGRCRVSVIAYRR
jgi:hypothetical protein